MKKLLLTFAALVLSTAAFAQDIDFEELGDLNKIEISKAGARVETELSFAFPMYFGWSTLTDVNAKGAWTSINDGNWPNVFDTRKNFAYGLQLVDMRIRYNMLDVSLGLRWTFMDFTLANSLQTFRKIGPEGTVIWLDSGSSSDVWWPYPIQAECSNYDGRKSKIHATYFGIPLRVGLDFGSSEVYVGASVEMLTGGYTKYKRPKNRQNAKDLFNPVRATLEGGFTYGGLGIYVQYGLTPLFSPELSDAKTLTFGILLGM
jgi:hypothetical protein